MSGSHTLTLEATVREGPSRYEFHTADGVVSPDAFREEELLLLEVCWERQLGSLLVVQGNYGVVGTVLAAGADSVRTTETSARAARLCRTNAARNDATVGVSLVESPACLEGTFDTACYAPAGYIPIALGKQRLVDALSRLRPGGRLYVAGDATTGLQRYESCLADHCRTVETVHRSGGTRILAATRPDEFDPPTFVESRTFEATVDGVELTLVSRPGLFSAGSLDRGTRLLAETASIRPEGTVLDLACGYGPLGTYAAAVSEADVLLSDDDVRATAAANRSLEATGVDGTVVTADATRGIDRRVDQVLCNPPTHAGDGVLADLFAGVSDCLAPGGSLSVVHHRRLDLDDFLRQVGEITDRHRGEEHDIVTVDG